jgi:hypothetical protein
MQGISMSANIVNKGGVQAIFNGTPYQATNYQVSFSATNSSTQTVVSAAGTIVSMPSGLVYSVNLSINGTSQLNAQLLSTNLPLTNPPSNVNVLGATIVGAGVVAAVAIAVPAAFKLKHKTHADTASTDEKKETPQNDGESKNSSEEKPSYWVD